MKKILISILTLVVVVLSLTGCVSRYGSIDEAQKAKEKCHSLHGTFTMKSTGDGSGYYWFCDISDKKRTHG